MIKQFIVLFFLLATFSFIVAKDEKEVKECQTSLNGR